MTHNNREAAKALKRLALRLDKGFDTQLSPDGFRALEVLLSEIPLRYPSENEYPRLYFKDNDPLGNKILQMIVDGDEPRGHTSEMRNALTRLRRNGRIANVGTRKNPIYKIVED